jgi:hypothetical protein
LDPTGHNPSLYGAGHRLACSLDRVFQLYRNDGLLQLRIRVRYHLDDDKIFSQRSGAPRKSRRSLVDGNRDPPGNCNLCRNFLFPRRDGEYIPKDRRGKKCLFEIFPWILPVEIVLGEMVAYVRALGQAKIFIITQVLVLYLIHFLVMWLLLWNTDLQG